jgi:pyruvate,water dikinase
VIDAGGLLSHTAIVSRDYGIPSVVGTRKAPASSRTGPELASAETPARVTVL